MEQRVLTRLSKDFQVGSEDCNDVVFTGQKIRWTRDSTNGPYIEVSEDKAIDELEEIPVERNTKEDLQCTLAMHNMQQPTGTEIGCRVGHSYNVVTSSPDAVQWQLHQQVTRRTIENTWIS